MGDDTKIEWTDATLNPFRARNRETGKVGWHCEHASEGCRHCYAEKINLRLGTGLPFTRQSSDLVDLYLDERTLFAPLRWQRPRRIFITSMSDLAAEFVTQEMLDKLFAMIALAPRHTFQLLTKRIDLLRAYLEDRSKPDEHGHPAEDIRVHLTAWANTPSRRWTWPQELRLSAGKYCKAIAWPLPNAWIGTSVEDQRNTDERIPDLLAAPAAVRFLSVEPMIGKVDITPWLWGPARPCADCPRDLDCDCYFETRKSYGEPSIDWVICGGESGPEARPMDVAWPRSLRDQCVGAKVPYFYKQHGEWAPAPDTLNFSESEAWADGKRVEHFSSGNSAVRLGKKAAGRLLDGREWSEFPR